MKRLLRNTIINVGAFGVVSLINLLVIPFLIAAYGLEEYGMIVLAKILLPAGVMILFDFGMSESVTKFVASSEARSDYKTASIVIKTSSLMALVIGMFLAIALTPFVDVLANAINVDSVKVESFSNVIFWHSLALVLLFPSLMFESAIKGLERFGVIRVAEIISAIVYAVSVTILIQKQMPYYFVVYAYLIIYCVRSIFYLYYVLSKSTRITLAIVKFDKAVFTKMMRHAVAIFKGKSISTVFNNISHILIGIMYGSYAIGAYDALQRLPKFGKMIFGLVNSAILPASSKLEANEDRASMKLLLENGTIYSVSISIPLVIGAIMFSDTLVGLWMGENYLDQAGWLKVYFLWPAIVSVISLGATMLVARRSALVALNRISLFQLTVFLLVVAILHGYIGFHAFILGTVLSVLCVLPFQIRVIAREYQIGYNFYTGLFTKIMLASIPSFLWYLFVSTNFEATGLLYLFMGLSGWCLIYGFTVYMFVYTTIQKNYVKNCASIFKE